MCHGTTPLCVSLIQISLVTHMAKLIQWGIEPDKGKLISHIQGMSLYRSLYGLIIYFEQQSMAEHNDPPHCKTYPHLSHSSKTTSLDNLCNHPKLFWHEKPH